MNNFHAWKGLISPRVAKIDCSAPSRIKPNKIFLGFILLQAVVVKDCFWHPVALYYILLFSSELIVEQ